MAEASATEAAGKRKAGDLWDVFRQDLTARHHLVANMAESQLLAIEIAPGASDSALTGPVIILPSQWMAAGPSRQLSARSIDLRRALPDDMDAEGDTGKSALMTLRRMMLALWITPYIGKGRSLPKPKTWVIWCQHLIRMFRWVLSQHLSQGGPFFAHLSLDELAGLMGAVPGGSTQSVFARLTQFKYRGLWQDWPDIAALERRQDESQREEKSRKGHEKPYCDIKESRQWQPLPDAFVTEFGWRAKWFIEQLGESLLDCYEACLAVTDGCKETITKHRKTIIEGWNWRTPGGEKITALPFHMRLVSQDVEVWPPQSFRQLQQAIYVLQGTNLFAESMSMAGRTSDVLSIRDAPNQQGHLETATSSEGAEIEIKEAVDNVETGPARVSGRTFKLVERIGGAERDWPLPAIAVKAIILQRRLARMLRPSGTDHLWVCMSGNRGEGLGSPLNNITVVFDSITDVFGLRDTLGENDSFHHHRCRKTVARLVGLALVGAPKILMDLFGHKTIEMTLSYILSDPDFAAEVQEVAKAQIIIMGKEAIESAGSNGGEAAEGLREGVMREKARLGKEQFQAEGIGEMAEILTLNGKSCQLVRPGVICTKSPGEMGPCAKGTARIDPSRCKSDCSHRLELAALRDDVNRSITESVQHLQQAMADNDACMIEFWRGQLQHHLSRFPDIRDKWMAHPTLAGLLESILENAA